jgi:prepilin-type N-terminal cleavage/methylation domain-containing protein
MYTHQAAGKPSPRQDGFTLIELTVVLMVLIALAGLLLPYVGGYNESARSSTAADSLAEVNKAIDSYELRYTYYPNNFDTLHDGTSIISWLPSTTPTGVLTTVDLGADANAANIIKSLNLAGITYLRPMNPTNINASYATPPVAVSVGTTTRLVRIDSTPAGTPAVSPVYTYIQQGMGIQVAPADLTATPTNYYIVFGVGQSTDMTGRILKEAPVYFPGGRDNPTTQYCRYLAVFKVPLDGSSRASFIGTMTPDLKTQSQVASGHYQTIQSGN